MDNSGLDQLCARYKLAVDRWVEAIRAEEALADEDHSMTAFEAWDHAHSTEEDARIAAKQARDEYKDALRHALYGI